MGSEQDAKPDDDLRRKLLAVRNCGWIGGYIIGHGPWNRLVDELIAAVKKEALRDSTS